MIKQALTMTLTAALAVGCVNAERPVVINDEIDLNENDARSYGTQDSLIPIGARDTFSAADFTNFADMELNFFEVFMFSNNVVSEAASAAIDVNAIRAMVEGFNEAFYTNLQLIQLNLSEEPESQAQNALGLELDIEGGIANSNFYTGEVLTFSADDIVKGVEITGLVRMGTDDEWTYEAPITRTQVQMEEKGNRHLMHIRAETADGVQVSATTEFEIDR